MGNADRGRAGGRDCTCRLKSGVSATLRPPHAGDERALAAFHRALSDRSLFLRYFSVTRVEPRFDDEAGLALLAEVEHAEGGSRIVGVGALAPTADASSAEMAVLVADAYQGQGLGSELLRRLMAIAAERRIQLVIGEMLPENEAMVALARRLGFTLTRAPGDSRIVRATLRLE